VLEVRDLVKVFDGFVAVGGVSLDAPTGSIGAIIGPNGAGKTTLFNLITGHLRPDRGHVKLDGRDVTGIAPHDLCRLGVGRSFQRTNIFPRLTVFQNVQAAFLSHRGRGGNVMTPVERLYRDETLALLESIGLAARAGEVAAFLSHGGQKQLELGLALALERLARERGLTLLFTEHDMEVVFSISERITVLHQGRVIANGTPDEVRRDEAVRRVYLGERH